MNLYACVTAVSTRFLPFSAFFQPKIGFFFVLFFHSRHKGFLCSLLHVSHSLIFWSVAHQKYQLLFLPGNAVHMYMKLLLYIMSFHKLLYQTKFGMKFFFFIFPVIGLWQFFSDSQTCSDWTNFQCIIIVHSLTLLQETCIYCISSLLTK